MNSSSERKKSYYPRLQTTKHVLPIKHQGNFKIPGYEIIPKTWIECGITQVYLCYENNCRNQPWLIFDLNHMFITQNVDKSTQTRELTNYVRWIALESRTQE